MGRPKASDRIRDFATEFARLVTVPSCDGNTWVARKGRYSIYALLARLAPTVRNLLPTLRLGLPVSHWFVDFQACRFGLSDGKLVNRCAVALSKVQPP